MRENSYGGVYLMLMSALGQKRTLEHVRVMSALPPKADIALHRSECLLCAKSGHSIAIRFAAREG